MRRCFYLFTLLSVALLAMGCRQASGPEELSESTPSKASPLSVASTLLGVVLLEGQSDAGGTQVYLPGTSQVAITNARGEYRLDGIPPGQYAIEAQANGYQRAVIGAVDVPAGEGGKEYPLETYTLARLKRNADDRIAEADFGAIRGSVKTSNPRIPANFDWTRCRIELLGTVYRTNCMPDGQFLLWNLPPDQYTLTVIMEGFEPRVSEVRVLPGPPSETVQIMLRSLTASLDRVLSGSVVLLDADEEPSDLYEGILVQVIGQPGLTATPDLDGKFVMRNLPPGIYRLTASGAGYRAAEPMEINLTEVPEGNVELTLRTDDSLTGGTARISGMVLKDIDGETDMSGITVALAGTSRVAVTDALGQYSIEQIPPGSYQIIAKSEGFKSASQGPVDLEAGQEIEIEGMLLDPVRNYPKVLSTTPADGADDVAISREIPIAVRFSKKMVPESLRRAVRIDPEVAFRVYAGGDLPQTDFDLMRIVIFGAEGEPVAQFRTRYTITIDTMAEDFEGLSLEEPYELTLTTGLPAVVATVPADGEIFEGLGSGVPVAIYFNAKMDRGTLDASSLNIRPRMKVLPGLSVDDDPVTGWTRLYINYNWQPDTKYDLTILPSARTLGRHRLTNTPYRFTFRTPRLTLDRQPTIPVRP